MVIEVKKRENENLGSLLFRFQKRVKQSGIMREARNRRFHKRSVNRIKRRASALHRVKKERELARERKYGRI
ncbi:MAG: 30S ribosomal protein S21 [Candidatus Brennerbacteria bacterium]|nr:30S ribosomal protein S21 [Candidatus Brennerbacteria bacterium]